MADKRTSRVDINNISDERPGKTALPNMLKQEYLQETKKHSSEEKFRILIDSSEDCICHISLDGKFVSMNAAGCTFNEINSDAEIIGTDANESIIENKEEADKALRSASKGKTSLVQYKSISRTGKEIWWDSKITPVKDSSGAITSILRISRDITERKYSEERLARINECLLNLSTADRDKNISSLTALCGELLEATCALYNRLDNGLLISTGQWNVPPDYDPVDKPDGHICYDVIKSCSGQPLVITDLQNSKYANTDSNVAKYSLRTYLGHPVRLNDDYVGSLCVVYQEDKNPTESEKKILGIIAAAIASEEERELYHHAMETSERKYRALVDDAVVGIYQTDIEGNILFGNAELVRMFEFDSFEDLAKETVFPLYVNAGQRDDLLKTLKIKGSIRNFEATFFTKSGKQINTLLSAYYDSGILSGMLRDITEIKKTTEALKESEERYKLLFVSNPQPMWVFDLKTLKFLAVNNAAINHYGYSEEEFLSMNIKDIRPREDIPALVENINLASPGIENAGLWRHIIKDGSIIYVEVIAHSIDYLGRKAQLILANDVTEKKIAEAKIEESLSLNKATLESTADGILVVDLKGVITSFNQKFVEMWNIPQDIINSRDDNKALSFVLSQLEEPERFIEKVKELYNKPGEESFDIIKFKDRRIFERLSKPQKINNRYVGRVWSFRDVTDKEVLTAKIISAKNDWEKTFDSIIDVITIHNTSHTIIRTNKAIAKFTDLPLEQIIGKKCYEIFHGTCKPIKGCVLKRCLETKKSANLTFEDRKLGKTFSITASPLMQNNEITGILHIMRDVTLEKATAKKLLDTSEQERKTISQEIHDGMLQLLYGALIYCRKAEEINDDRSAIVEAVSLIEQAMDSGRKLISGLRPSIDLGLSYCIHEFAQNLFSNYEIKLHEDLEDVQKSDIDIVLYRISQELLMNVVKHSKAKNCWITIKNKLSSIDLIISDDGRGFDFEEKMIQKKISDGHIGLHTMIERAESLGGACRIESKPNGGTAVAVMIPKPVLAIDKEE